MLSLPADFVYNIEHYFNEEGKAWLPALPSLLDEATRRWGLTLGKPFLLSCNYVCEARGANGADLVLKAGVPNAELASEIEALRLYDGHGAVRLIDADAEKGLLLEERLRPGTMLLEVRDDAQAMEIAAGVMRSLWHPLSSRHFPRNSAENGGTRGGFIRLDNWFDKGFKQYHQKFGGGTGPLPHKIVETAEGLVADFFAENEPPVVLHGDFHHYNVLKAGEDWKVIDPKGVIGPRGYDVGPLLINPLNGLLHGPDAKQIIERRFAILSEQLGMERSRIRGWGIAHAALSAWWSLDEQGHGGEHAIHCAELFMETR
jgi:streptomycin 6-kinase